FSESRPSGQTVGKRLVGIRVVVFTDGGPLDVRRAALRAALRFVESAGLGIGFLAAFFDREKQAWHDVAGQTVVVPVAHYPVR
ncbi:MAG TPA: RDD family protein, partial [Acidimicrobiales bacterium]